MPYKPRRSYSSSKKKNNTMPQKAQPPQAVPVMKQPTMKDSITSGIGLGMGAAAGNAVFNGIANGLTPTQNNNEVYSESKCLEVKDQFKNCIRMNGLNQCLELEEMLNYCLRNKPQ